MTPLLFAPSRLPMASPTPSSIHSNGSIFALLKGMRLDRRRMTTAAESSRVRQTVVFDTSGHCANRLFQRIDRVCLITWRNGFCSHSARFAADGIARDPLLAIV